MIVCIDLLVLVLEVYANDLFGCGFAKDQGGQQNS
jgi:hypothetical protein